MEPRDFLVLLKHSKTLIGNSSVGIRECAYLGVPVVNIGNRQNRRLRAQNVIDVKANKSEIKLAIEQSIERKNLNSSNIYGNGEAGKKIADILAKTKLSFSKTITY